MWVVWVFALLVFVLVGGLDSKQLINIYTSLVMFTQYLLAVSIYNIESNGISVTEG